MADKQYYLNEQDRKLVQRLISWGRSFIFPSAGEEDLLLTQQAPEVFVARLPSVEPEGGDANDIYRIKPAGSVLCRIYRMAYLGSEDDDDRALGLISGFEKRVYNPYQLDFIPYGGFFLVAKQKSGAWVPTTRPSFIVGKTMTVEDEAAYEEEEGEVFPPVTVGGAPKLVEVFDARGLGQLGTIVVRVNMTFGDPGYDKKVGCNAAGDHWVLTVAECT